MVGSARTSGLVVGLRRRVRATLGQAADKLGSMPGNVRGSLADQPCGQRDEGADEGLGLGFGLGLGGRVAEVLHHRVRVDAEQRIRHPLGLVFVLVLPFAFELVLVFPFAFELVLPLFLALPLLFELFLALAQQAADDAAEVELFALEFFLEFGKRTVMRGARRS